MQHSRVVVEAEKVPTGESPRSSHPRVPEEAVAETEASTWGFWLYLVFTCSWFMHLGSRIPLLGTIRFDFLLIILLVLAIAVSRLGRPLWIRDRTSTVLLLVILFIVVTIPFVQWPGSVVRQGLIGFIRGAVFYYFTVYLVTSRRRLKWFIGVFLACQAFRVLEPLYLHLTQGYWGSVASMANWESMERLSGAPSDTVNPNGLAFIICTVYPFFHYLSGVHWFTGVVYAASAPLLVYALLLTGSRSGFLGLVAILVGILIKSRKRGLVLAGVAVAAVVAFNVMTPDQKDRYLSIFSPDTKNYATAHGRIRGVMDDLKVALRRPIVGHGVGTSAEANAHFSSDDKPSHNLYTEVAEEIGFAGLLLYLVFMFSIANNFARSVRNIKNRLQHDRFLTEIAKAMQVWFLMNLLFSFASYGLSSYEWYLFGGLSVMMIRLSQQSQPGPPGPLGGGVVPVSERTGRAPTASERARG